MPTTIVTTTFWDLLKAPSLCLHLPRFGLFLLVAIPLEIYADRKRVCPSCALATVFLQLITGVAGIVMIYYLMSMKLLPGSRIPVPFWYYPLVLILGGVPSGCFIAGIRRLLAMRRIRNAVVRCLIFMFTLYFLLTAVATPFRVNRMLDRWDAQRIQNDAAP